MKPETRQTLIGVFGMSLVMVMALSEGFNGKVTITYFISIIAIVAPQALEDLPFTGGGK